MAINLRNARTEALVRELARRRGIGLTEAVHEAVEEAVGRDGPDTKSPGQVLRGRLQPLFDRMDLYPSSGQKADKAFFDDLWGQGDD